MRIYYSAQNGGFFNDDLHEGKIPKDAVEITQETHEALLAGQVFGKRIVAGPDGQPILQDQPEPTDQEKIDHIVASVQAHMDDVARSRGYDDIKSAVTYADEPSVQKFQQEGIAFRSWRSLVWQECYQLLDEVKAGTRQPLDAAGVIALLPPITLP